jgi:hypothetical protein
LPHLIVNAWQWQPVEPVHRQGQQSLTPLSSFNEPLLPPGPRRAWDTPRRSLSCNASFTLSCRSLPSRAPGGTHQGSSLRPAPLQHGACPPPHATPIPNTHNHRVRGHGVARGLARLHRLACAPACARPHPCGCCCLVHLPSAPPNHSTTQSHNHSQPPQPLPTTQPPSFLSTPPPSSLPSPRRRHGDEHLVQPDPARRKRRVVLEQQRRADRLEALGLPMAQRM